MLYHKYHLIVAIILVSIARISAGLDGPPETMFHTIFLGASMFVLFVVVAQIVIHYILKEYNEIMREQEKAKHSPKPKQKVDVFMENDLNSNIDIIWPRILEFAIAEYRLTGNISDSTNRAQEDVMRKIKSTYNYINNLPADQDLPQSIFERAKNKIQLVEVNNFIYMLEVGEWPYGKYYGAQCNLTKEQEYNIW